MTKVLVVVPHICYSCNKPKLFYRILSVLPIIFEVGRGMQKVATISMDFSRQIGKGSN